MPKPPKPKTEEAAVLASAFKASGAPKMGHVADELGVTPGQISQWVSGHRPVPWDKAAKLADLLGISPEQISIAYRAAAEHFQKDTRHAVADQSPASYATWQAYEKAAPETRTAIDLLLLPMSERERLDDVTRLAIATLEKTVAPARTRTPPAAA